MRASYEPNVAAAEALRTRHDLHIANYGYGIEERLTGQHETASYKEFSYGVSRPRRFGAHPVAGRRSTARATSRTAGPTRTWTPTS